MVTGVKSAGQHEVAGEVRAVMNAVANLSWNAVVIPVLLRNCRVHCRLMEMLEDVHNEPTYSREFLERCCDEGVGVWLAGELEGRNE